MDRAVRAIGLVFPERTFVESLVGIREQFRACGAEISGGFVMIVTIDPHHCINGFVPFDNGRLIVHRQ